MTDNVSSLGTIYYIDRLTLNIRENLRTIRSIINANHLENYGRGFTLRKPNEATRLLGYKSQLNVEVPKDELYPALSNILKGIEYSIFSVEIARDTLYQTEFDTIRKSNIINKTLRKKWSIAWVYDAFKDLQRYLSRRRPPHSEELYHSKTSYAGGKKFKYKVYDRISKIANQPCVHCEWTIVGSPTVKKKVDVKTLRGLANLDVKEKFSKFYQKFISYEEIDNEKHGRFIQNMSPRSRHAGVMRNGIRAGAKKMIPRGASNQFVRAESIDSSAKLRNYYALQKKNIKEKLNRGEPLSIREKKILKLSYRRFNTFFKPIEDPLSNAPVTTLTITTHVQ